MFTYVIITIDFSEEEQFILGGFSMYDSQIIRNEWEKITNELVRESWRFRLPSRYDVYCLHDFKFMANMHIPGNLYVSGNVHCRNLIVDGDLIVDSNIHCRDLTVKGNLIVNGYISTNSDITVNGNLIVNYGDVSAFNIDVSGDLYVFGCVTCCNNLNTIGNAVICHNATCYSIYAKKDLIVGHEINSSSIFVCGLLSCYDVLFESKIYAADYICKRYEREFTGK